MYIINATLTRNDFQHIVYDWEGLWVDDCAFLWSEAFSKKTGPGEVYKPRGKSDAYSGATPNWAWCSQYEVWYWILNITAELLTLITWGTFQM